MRQRLIAIFVAAVLCISMTACMRSEKEESSGNDMIIEQPPISQIEPPAVEPPATPGDGITPPIDGNPAFTDDEPPYNSPPQV